jgi:flagellar basal body-associated protein FliL
MIISTARGLLLYRQMSKTLKIIIALNVILLVLALVFGTIYVFYKRQGSSTDNPQKLTQGDIKPQDESTSGVNIEGDRRMRATFKSIQGNEMEVVILTGETKSYPVSNKLFYLCLNSSNQQMYEALKEDSNNIDDSIAIIEAEIIVERVSVGENLELFLYTHTQNSPTLIKGIVSFDCE